MQANFVPVPVQVPFMLCVNKPLGNYSRHEPMTAIFVDVGLKCILFNTMI